MGGKSPWKEQQYTVRYRSYHETVPLNNFCLSVRIYIHIHMYCMPVLYSHFTKEETEKIQTILFSFEKGELYNRTIKKRILD